MANLSLNKREIIYFIKTMYVIVFIISVGPGYYFISLFDIFRYG